MTNHIRKARPDDAFRLAEIEVFNYRLNFYPIFKTDDYFFNELNVPAVIKEYLAEPELTENSFVFDDGVVKGFIRVKGDYIEKLFVEPVFQGMGIGGALLEYAVTQLAAKRLLVLERNINAIRFYERHGFCRTGKKQDVDNTGKYLLEYELMPYDNAALR